VPPRRWPGRARAARCGWRSRRHRRRGSRRRSCRCGSRSSAASAERRSRPPCEPAACPRSGAGRGRGAR